MYSIPSAVAVMLQYTASRRMCTNHIHEEKNATYVVYEHTEKQTLTMLDGYLRCLPAVLYCKMLIVTCPSPSFLSPLLHFTCMMPSYKNNPTTATTTQAATLMTVPGNSAWAAPPVKGETLTGTTGVADAAATAVDDPAGATPSHALLLAGELDAAATDVSVLGDPEPDPLPLPL